MNGKELYEELMTDKYQGKIYSRRGLGENMEVKDELFGNYWKPRFVLNHDAEEAFEFMNGSACLVGVGMSDILWEALTDIPQDYMDMIEARSAYYPTFIFRYEKGLAQVRWQINPDGRYFMDEDGYGMTSDVEFNLYSYIDKRGHVIIPYQPVKDSNSLRKLREEAELLMRTKYR